MAGPIELPCDTPEDFIFMNYFIAIVYDNEKGKWYASAERPERGIIFSPYVTNKQSAISDIKEYLIEKRKDKRRTKNNMPPTKIQLENLQSMVAEIGVENVVEMAIKSAGGRPMDEGLHGGEIDARRRIEAIRNNAAYTAGLLSEALEKRNSTIKKK